MKKTFDEQIFRRSEDFRNWSQEPSHLFRFRVILRFVYLNYSNGQKMTLRCHLRNRRVFYLQVTQSIYNSKFGYSSWIFRANLSSKFRKNLKAILVIKRSLVFACGNATFLIDNICSNLKNFDFLILLQSTMKAT